MTRKNYEDIVNALMFGGIKDVDTIIKIFSYLKNNGYSNIDLNKLKRYIEKLTQNFPHLKN